MSSAGLKSARNIHDAASYTCPVPKHAVDYVAAVVDGEAALVNSDTTPEERS